MRLLPLALPRRTSFVFFLARGPFFFVLFSRLCPFHVAAPLWLYSRLYCSFTTDLLQVGADEEAAAPLWRCIALRYMCPARYVVLPLHLAARNCGWVTVVLLPHCFFTAALLLLYCSFTASLLLSKRRAQRT